MKLDPEELVIAAALDRAELEDANERGAGARIEFKPDDHHFTRTGRAGQGARFDDLGTLRRGAPVGRPRFVRNQACIAGSWRGSRSGAMRPPWSIGFKMTRNRHPGRRRIGAWNWRVGVRGSIIRRRPSAGLRSASRGRAQRLNDPVTAFSHNVRMSERYPLALRQADRARTDFATIESDLQFLMAPARPHPGRAETIGDRR